MTKAISRIINKVKTFANRDDKHTIDGDTISQKWLQDLRIVNQIRLFPDFYGAWIIYENKNYLALVNHNDKEFSIPQFLTETNINSGCWVAIVGELDLSLKTDIDKSQLEEVLNSDWEINSEGFKKIKFDELSNNIPPFKGFFPDITFYEVASGFTKKEELNQIVGSILVDGSSCRLLPYDQDVIQEFKSIFQNGNNHIPFDNLLVSYVASEFKFSYLDLYRCIERLQPLYFFNEFYTSLSPTQKSLQEFCKDFYDKTKLTPSLVSSLEKLLGSIKTKTTKDLYNIRNQIVHLRPNQDNDLIPKDIKEWNALILEMLTIVKDLYATNTNLLD